MENTRRNRRHCTGYPYKDSMFVACVASVSLWFRSKERPRNDEERNFRILAAREMVARSLTLVARNRTETLATQVTMFRTFRFFNKLLPKKFLTKFVCVCLRADISYFLCCTQKRDVCVTPSLIVFQRPAGFPRSWEHDVIG